MCVPAATAIDFLQHCEVDGDLKYRNILVRKGKTPHLCMFRSMLSRASCLLIGYDTLGASVWQQAIANRHRSTLEINLDDLAEVRCLHTQLTCQLMG